MQAAEMLRGTRAYVYHLVFLISLSVDYVHPLPLQVLPSIPGYIPVYIRYGDQPLEEINPALAEAFREGSSFPKANLANIGGPSDISLEEDGADKNKVEAIHVRQVDNNFATEDEKNKEPAEVSSETETSKRKAVSQPVVKVLPLTEEEKDALNKFEIEIKEETKNSNSVHDSSSNPSELLNEPHREDVRPFSPVVKVDQIITDESVKPDLHLIENVPHSSTDEGAPASTLTDEILPVKEQRLPNVLANVHKLAISPELSHQFEKERIENQSLDEKSK